MVAVDTNVLVRFLVDDDPDQSRAARALFASEAVWIPKTVILETNWVLCSLFGLTDVEVARALSRLLSVEGTCRSRTARPWGRWLSWSAAHGTGGRSASAESAKGCAVRHRLTSSW